MLQFYSYRWFIAGMLSLFVGAVDYWFFCQPQLRRIQQLTVAEKILRNEWHVVSQKQVLQPNFKLKQNENNIRLQSLLRLAADMGLEVQSVNMAVEDLNPNSQVRLSFSGVYESLIEFLFSLIKLPNPVFVRDFAFVFHEGRQIEVEMSIAFYTDAIATSHQEFSTEFNNPFCLPFRSDVQVSLLNMRFVGFIQQDSYATAFMQLTNGKIITLVPGEIVGVERSKVIEVTRDFVTLQRLDGSQTRLKLIR